MSGPSPTTTTRYGSIPGRRLLITTGAGSTCARRPRSRHRRLLPRHRDRPEHGAGLSPTGERPTAAKGDNAARTSRFPQDCSSFPLPPPPTVSGRRSHANASRGWYSRAPPPPTPSAGPRRVALVIGNSNYTHAGLLTNPSQRRTRRRCALCAAGLHRGVEQYDISRDKMGRALRDFGDSAEGAEWAMVFFAGHGLEVNGTSYLVPTDAELKRETHVSDEAISLTQVQAKVDAAAKLGLVILDSCRNNPFLTRMVRSTATRSLTRGLSPVEPEGNVLVAYAAKHGTTAEDGIRPAQPLYGGLARQHRGTRARDKLPVPQGARPRAREDEQAPGAVPLRHARQRTALLQGGGATLGRCAIRPIGIG